MEVTSSIQAVSVLLGARRSVYPISEAFTILDRALWTIIYNLTGEELNYACFLVSVDCAKSRARLS